MTVYRYVRTGRLPGRKIGVRMAGRPGRPRSAPPSVVLTALSSGTDGTGVVPSRRSRADYRRAWSNASSPRDEHGSWAIVQSAPGRWPRPERPLPRCPRAGPQRHRRRMGRREHHRRPGAPGVGRGPPADRSARPPVHPPRPHARLGRARRPGRRPATACRRLCSPTCCAARASPPSTWARTPPRASFVDTATRAERLVAVGIGATAPGNDDVRGRPRRHAPARRHRARRAGRRGHRLARPGPSARRADLWAPTDPRCRGPLHRAGRRCQPEPSPGQPPGDTMNRPSRYSRNRSI